MKEAAQHFDYVGHHINFATCELTPIPHKLRESIRKTKHQLKATTTSPKHLAGLAGNLLDAGKSNVALLGLSKQVMQCAAKGVHKNFQTLGHWNKNMCWGKTVDKASIPGLQQLLSRCLLSLLHPTPLIFRPKTKMTFILTTDASDDGWGASLTFQGAETHACSMAWEPAVRAWHSTHKEALATNLAIHHLLDKIPTGCRLVLRTDCTPVCWAWKKGTTNTRINNCVAPAVISLHRRKIQPVSTHIAGQLNRRADWLSRHVDPKNYMLQPSVFQSMCKKYDMTPDIDLFASRENAQLPKYCSWRVDKKSLGNAFDMNWTGGKFWLNPPWELIPRVLRKMQREPCLALVCLPA